MAIIVVIAANQKGINTSALAIYGESLLVHNEPGAKEKP